MKSLRNKVILSGIVLLFAFIATIGSTYAWFTVSTDATVTGVNLQVAASQNLLITPSDYTTPGNDTLVNLRDTNYYPTSLIDLARLQAKGYLPSGTPWRLRPATIYGGGSDATSIALTYISNMEAVMAGNGTTPTPTYTAATSNSDGGHYIQIKLWLLSQAGETQDLFLNDLTIASAEGNSSAQSIIVNAVRVSFTFEDNQFDLSGEGYTPVGLSTSFIYGNDADTLYAIPTTLDNVLLGTPPTAPAVATPVSSTPALYQLNENVPTLVTINIFVEGWDEDANNDVILAGFNISFGFTIANAA